MVSVIIPTYNREKSILKSVMSVLDQSYSDLELIIVDDGSTDDTPKIISSIRDKRLKYIRINNSGACNARNTGISEAKGDFIAFHDSDDIWLEDKLEKQMEVMNQYHPDIVFCKLNWFIDGSFEGYLPKNITNGFVEPIVSLFDIGTQTIVARKKVFDDIKFDATMPRWQDFEWLLRATEKYTLYCLDKGLVDYYVGSDSISLSSEKLYKACEIINIKHPLFNEKYPLMANMISDILFRNGAVRYEKKDSEYKRWFNLCKEYSVDKKKSKLCDYYVIGLYPIYEFVTQNNPIRFLKRLYWHVRRNINGR